ncbi:MAG: hypothetical protein KJ804_01095 [Proteobacteria bacterium]|nr:hypothetical protein [Pseudomonadota bacterium]MBU1056905.1 hypothetical protein [Pseudomonadota bacterium]
MAPSDEKNRNHPSSKKSSNFLPAVIIFLIFVGIGGFLFYFQSGSDLSISTPPDPSPKTDSSSSEKSDSSARTDTKDSPPADPINIPGNSESDATVNEQTPEPVTEQNELAIDPTPAPEAAATRQDPLSAPSPDGSREKKGLACKKNTAEIDRFYQHLDQQPYMTNYQLSTSSKVHFTALIQKLLANPPQVTRETDDLYTILKNTAHFFRISGKDNIQMLKGILDSERGRVEDILGAYYSLITSSDCSDTPYVSAIDQNALYEYACFFLNTMGGRLYLFRRDSLSRMVVTYYAISLINRANEENNNRYGIDLKPAVDLLLLEMERGGSSLKKQDYYLDTLYKLKEKYQ